MNQTEAIVEALLFASDRPLSLSVLNTLIDQGDAQQIQEAIAALAQRYDHDGHSFHIVQVAGGYQICSRPDYAKWIKALYRTRARARLSKPALETLAIIAYKQPIVRAEIESLRGVHIDGVLQTLMERHLITVKGRKASVGRPLLYGTTEEFLRYFGLNKITDLPAKGELQTLLDHSKPAEGLVKENEDTAEQVLGPERRDLQTSSGSAHPGGANPS